jgi:hypothetical protein
MPSEHGRDMILEGLAKQQIVNGVTNISEMSAWAAGGYACLESSIRDLH